LGMVGTVDTQSIKIIPVAPDNTLRCYDKYPYLS